jgi:hypothetical protein
MKHTPGPWKLNYPHPSTENFIIGNDIFEDFVMNPIAEIMPPVCESEAQQLDEQEANAKLIAAAPELLEALMETRKLNLHLYTRDSVGYLVYNKINDAIKKATK